MSLKQTLLNKIQNDSYVSLNELFVLTRNQNHKEATCERELRRLEEDGKIRQDKPGKFIIGYYNNGQPEKVEEPIGVAFEMMKYKEMSQDKLKF